MKAIVFDGEAPAHLAEVETDEAWSSRAPGERATGLQPLDGALEHHPAALGASARADVDDVVGGTARADRVLQRSRVHGSDLPRTEATTAAVRKTPRTRPPGRAKPTQ